MKEHLHRRRFLKVAGAGTGVAAVGGATAGAAVAAPSLVSTGVRPSGIDVTSIGLKNDGTPVGLGLAYILSLGGDWYFPAGRYMIDVPTVATLVNATHLHVTCSAGAVFEAAPRLDGSMITIRTSGSSPKRLVWDGGIFDMGLAMNSRKSPPRSVGRFEQGTASLTNALNVTGGLYSTVLLQNGLITGRYRSYLDEFTDPRSQHWMGDPDDVAVRNGGDSGIYVDSRGDVTIANWTMLGIGDAGLYLSGPHIDGPTHFSVRDCRFYWCNEGVAVKASVRSAKVAGCRAYGCEKAFVATEGKPLGVWGAPHGAEFVGCVAEIYHKAFYAYRSDKDVGAPAPDRTRIVDCEAVDGGYLGWNGEATTCHGSVRIEGGSAGDTIDSITVGGTELLTSPVAHNGSDIDTASALVAAINNGPGGFPASNWNDKVWITGDDVDGSAVAASTTGVLITTADMRFRWRSPRALWLGGATRTNVRDFSVRGVVDAWRANRTRAVEALEIRSLPDVQTVDTTIRDLVVEDIDKMGGETAVTGASDPDRTRIDGVTVYDVDTPTIELRGPNSYVNA